MTATQERAGRLEVRSIDYVPLNERHGKVWHLGPLWFMSNAQIATLAVGLIGISEGRSLFWTWAPSMKAPRPRHLTAPTSRSSWGCR